MKKDFKYNLIYWILFILTIVPFLKGYTQSSDRVNTTTKNNTTLPSGSNISNSKNLNVITNLPVKKSIALVSAIVPLTAYQSLGAVQNFIFFSSLGAVSNTGNSTIVGNVGSNLGAVSGFNAPSILTGNIYAATSVTTQAKIDLLKLYIDISAIAVTNTIHAAVFGGSTDIIKSGVYTIPGAGSMAGNLILDGDNNSNSVFILKFEGAFSVAAGSSVSLINGATPSNVFWIAEGAIAIGANSTMSGTFIAHTGAASMAAGGQLTGRLLSTVGAVSFGPGKANLPLQTSALPAISINSCTDLILKSVSDFTLFSSVGAVSNTGSSGIIGKVGTNAGAITGFETSATTLMGNTNNGDAVSAQAAADLLAGYTILKNMNVTNSSHPPAFGGNEIVKPGIYKITSAGSIAGTITLDGTGVTNPTFIFTFGGAITVAAQTKMILKNVSHCNVYWIAEGAITIGALSFMKGVFIANNGANTLGANSNLEGNLFSTAGAINFNTSVGYIYYMPCTVTNNATSKIANSFVFKNMMVNITENKLSVFPNPARGGIINMAITGNVSKVKSVEIIDISGKIVYAAKCYQSIINLSNNPAGIYFVRVNTGSTIITSKFIKE